MTRSEAREQIMDILYESAFDKAPADLTAHYELAIAERGVADDSFIRSTLHGISDHRDAIAQKIEQYSVGWKTKRISRVSYAILTLAVYEILFEPEIPRRVSLNEAVELAKKYDDEKAYGFVNGVLNAVMHDSAAVGEV